jgi:hypothetical protein
LADAQNSGGTGTSSGAGVVDTPRATAALAEISETSRRGPGRPPGSGKGPATPKAIDPKLAAQLQKLFTPKQWRMVVSLYPNARFAITGWEGFKLTQEEGDMLSESLSVMMETLVMIDPKYLALMLFGVNFFGVIASKEMQFAAVRKKAIAAQRAAREQEGK